MQLPPPAVLAAWPAPNYKDPVSRNHELVIITGVLFPIAFFMLSLRAFTRLYITKAWGADDIFLLCAAPPTTAIAGATIHAVQRWGWDRHIWDVQHQYLSKGLKLLMALECLFAIAVSCTKVSVLILTNRMVKETRGVHRHLATIGIVVVAAEAVIFCIVVINTCSPVSEYWTLSFKPQHCINEKIHLLVAGIINTSTDFFVFLLPLSVVCRLKMHFRQQVAMNLLFAAGFAICVAGTVRIIYTWKTTISYDRTWESYGLWISSVIELYVGIICAAALGCKPFFTRYLPDLLGSSIAQSKGAAQSASLQAENRESVRLEHPSRRISAKGGSIAKSPSSYGPGEGEASFTDQSTIVNQDTSPTFFDSRSTSDDESAWVVRDGATSDRPPTEKKALGIPISKFSVKGGHI